MSTLRITCDHAQRRLKTPATNIALLGGELLDDSQDEDVILAPVINALMLKPYQMDLAWFTSNAGAYLKPTIASGYEVKTSGKWREVEVFPGAGKYLQCDDSSGEYARTSAAPGLNRGMALSFHLYSAQDTFLALQGGWSNSTTPTAQTASVGFELYSNGEVRIYKAGNLQSSGQGRRNNIGLEANQINHLILLPCRRRELLIFTRQFGQMGQGGPLSVQNGNGIAHVFDDIDEDEAAPIIVPAGEKFFVASGGAGNVQCQFAPLTFATTGDALSRIWSFGTPPVAGAALYEDWYNPKFPGLTEASVYGDTAFAGTTGVSAVTLMNEAGTSPFVADGEESRARVKSTLTGDGNYTPFVYGVLCQYEQVVAQTDSSEEFDLTPFFMSAQIDVPDDPFSATVNLELTLGLEEVDGGGANVVRRLEDEVPYILAQSYRPVKLALGEQPPFHDGYVKRPKLKDGIIDQVKRVAFGVEGLEQLIANYVFRTRIPFDGFPLCQPVEWGTSVVAKILAEAGFDLNQAVLSPVYKANSTDLFLVGEVPSEGCDEWNFAAEPGDTGRELLERAHRFCSDCVYGAHPGLNGTEFWFRTPEDLELMEPVITLYRSIDDAADAFPELDSDDLAELLYDSWEEETQELEANEVRATGVDPRRGDIFQSLAVDEASADPELAPSARPANWAGTPLPVGVSSRSFRQEEDTDRAVEGLLPTATQQLTVGGFSANTVLFYAHPDSDPSAPTLLPVWRMDIIHLDGVGDRRVSSVSGEFAKEVGDDDRVPSYHSRNASYTTGAVRGLGGTSVVQLQSRQRARLRDRFVQDLRAAPLIATGVVFVRQSGG